MLLPFRHKVSHFMYMGFFVSNILYFTYLLLCAFVRTYKEDHDPFLSGHFGGPCKALSSLTRVARLVDDFERLALIIKTNGYCLWPDEIRRAW